MPIPDKVYGGLVNGQGHRALQCYTWLGQQGAGIADCVCMTGGPSFVLRARCCAALGGWYKCRASQ